MELSVILKSIDVLGPENDQVKQLINNSSFIIYDSFANRLSRHFIHLRQIDVLKLKSNVVVDFDFVCNVLKPKRIKHENTIALNNLFVKLCNEGHGEVVDFFLSCLTPIDISFDSNQPLVSAIEGNHLDIVKSLVNHGVNPQDEYVINLACQEGRLDIIKFFYDSCGLIFSQQSILYAINGGHLYIVQYLYEHCGVDINEWAVKRAIYIKNMKILEYLLDICPPETYMMNTAINTTDDEMINFFYNTPRAHSYYDWGQIFLHSITMDNEMMFDKLLKKIKLESVDTGYTLCCKTDDLKYAKKLIPKTSIDVQKLYYYSIIENAIEITEYLLDSFGIEEIDKNFIKWVVEHNFKEILTLFIQHGVKVNSKYILLATNDEMIKYFLKKFNVKEKFRCTLLKKMVNEENVEIIKILMFQKTPVSDKIMLSAINIGNMDCIKFLSCGYNVTKEIILKTIELDTFEIFVFLYRLYGNSLLEFVDHAIQHGNVRIVQFFLSTDYFDEKQMLKSALKYKQNNVVKLLLKNF